MGMLFVFFMGLVVAGITIGPDNDDPPTNEPDGEAPGDATFDETNGIDQMLDAADGGEADAPDGQQQEVVTLERLTNDRDVLVSEDYRPQLVETFDVAVHEGELTAGQAADALASIDFRSGLVNVDALQGNDAVLGSTGNDTIAMGAGDDFVDGGAGDDTIRLGPGVDVTGYDTRVAERTDDLEPFPQQIGSLPGFTEEELEGGDDHIDGLRGDDYIADGYGANVLEGRSGNDFIVAVDQDGVTPDIVRGGNGDDVLFVDQGDEVTTGNGADIVIVEAPADPQTGYQSTVISDFVRGTDRLALEIEVPVGDAPPSIITTPNAPGTDGLVLIDGTTAIQVNGLPDLAMSDLEITLNAV